MPSCLQTMYVRMPIANTTFKGRTYYKGATQWKEGTKLNPCGRLKMRLNYIIYTNLNLKTMQASGHLTWVDWVGCIRLAERPHILLTSCLLVFVCHSSAICLTLSSTEWFSIVVSGVLCLSRELQSTVSLTAQLQLCMIHSILEKRLLVIYNRFLFL